MTERHMVAPLVVGLNPSRFLRYIVLRTYVTAILESRLYFQPKSSARVFAVSFVVSSYDSKFSVSDRPAQCPKRHLIVKFQ